MGVGPASIMVGNLVAGKRMAQAAGRELGVVEDQELIRKVALPLSDYSHCRIALTSRLYALVKLMN